MSDDLRLHEALLLLALKDDKGTIHGGTTWNLAVAGAVLAELEMAGKVDVTVDGKVETLDTAPIGDPLFDAVLAEIADTEKRYKVDDWLRIIWGWPKLAKTIAEPLVHRGILREEQGRILGIFPRTTFPEVDGGVEDRLIARLHDAIFGDGEVDAWLATLIALARPTSVLDIPFDRKELKARKERLDALVESETLGVAVKRILEQTVVFIATTAASVAVVTSVS